MAHVTTAEMEQMIEETFLVIERDDKKLDDRMAQLAHLENDALRKRNTEGITV